MRRGGQEKGGCIQGVLGTRWDMKARSSIAD